MDARPIEPDVRRALPAEPARRWNQTHIALGAVLAGTGWAAGLQLLTGGSLWVIAAVAVLTVVGSVQLLGWRRRTSGRADLVFVHHLLVAIAAAAVAGLHPAVPAAATLDVSVGGMFVIMGIGRIGCHVGCCCHGRPVTRGVAYGSGRLTLPAQGLADVPLAPVQLVESALGLTVATAGAILILLPSTPGTAAAIALTAYGLTRPLLEAWRGDGRRLRRGSLSPEVALPITLAVAATAGWAALVAGRTAPRAEMLAVVVVGAVASVAAFAHVRGGRLAADDLLVIAGAVRNCEHGAPSAIQLTSGTSVTIERPADGAWRITGESLSRRDAVLASRTALAVGRVARASADITAHRTRGGPS